MLFRLLFTCVVLACAANAQEPLDYRAALHEAETNNLELRAMRQQRAIALAGITTARLLPNPTVTFSAARDTPHEGFAIDQPFELGGKRGKRFAVAQEEQRSTELDIAALSRNVRRRTREAFFRALTARAQAARSKSALDLAAQTKDIVQQRYDAGDVAQLEVIQSDVELARADADYQLDLQSQRSADAQLAALLNRKLDAEASLTGSADAFPASPTLDAALTTSLQSNPELQKTAQDLRTEEKRLTLARSQRIPNIDLEVGTDFNSPPDFNVGPKGQIAVTLPLFNRGQGDVALSNARIQLLRLTLESLRTNVSAEVMAAWFDYTAKLHQAEQYRDRIVPQSVKLEQMAEDSYRSGKSNLLTLIDAQRRLNDVRKAYLDSAFETQAAFAQLEETVGVSLD